MHTISKKCVLLQRKRFRDVAQPGSALRSGRRGRKFESCHPDFFENEREFFISCLTCISYQAVTGLVRPPRR